MTLSKKEALALVEKAQRNEITEHYIYLALAKNADEHNRQILESIAKDELRHYNMLKGITGKDFQPDKLKVWLYTLLGRSFGFIFALKAMENGEGGAQRLYEKIKHAFADVAPIIKDEEKHEMKILNMLKEEKVEYAGSIVLGLNDALVELTGSIAGLSFALGKTRLVGIAGLIIGIAASLSMAASSYLSAKEEETENPLKASLYTGLAYILTVVLLVLPYFILNSVAMALLAMLGVTIFVIAAYTYYMSIVKDEPFFHRFGEMAAISLGVAAISYAIGWLLKKYVGVDV